jgi:hypothetical protein
VSAAQEQTVRNVPEHAGSTALDVAVGPFAAPVAVRAVQALGAQAGFGVDRLSDVVIIVEALVAHAGHPSATGRLALNVVTAPDRFVLGVGPLPVGAAAQLRRAARLSDLGSVIERLADEVTETRDTDGEYLLVTMRRPS